MQGRNVIQKSAKRERLIAVDRILVVTPNHDKFMWFVRINNLQSVKDRFMVATAIDQTAYERIRCYDRKTPVLILDYWQLPIDFLQAVKNRFENIVYRRA